LVFVIDTLPLHGCLSRLRYQDLLVQSNAAVPIVPVVPTFWLTLSNEVRAPWRKDGGGNPGTERYSEQFCMTVLI
jgi:hypothetical protein